VAITFNQTKKKHPKKQLKQIKASMQDCVSAYGLSNTAIKIVTLQACSFFYNSKFTQPMYYLQVSHEIFNSTV